MSDLRARVRRVFSVISSEFRYPLSTLDMTPQARSHANRDLQEIKSSRPEHVADALVEIGVGPIFGIAAASSYARKTRAASTFVELAQATFNHSSEETKEEE